MAYALPVFAASRLNINTGASGPGTSTFDGVPVPTLLSPGGVRVLLTLQTDARQNGVWIFKGPKAAMLRPAAPERQRRSRGRRLRPSGGPMGGGDSQKVRP
jgi:hypothetical protein